jgi:RimJ/RimL family protein N-acetyltransferase
VTDQLATFAAKPTLTGEHVVLRPLDIATDADRIREMLQDPEALRLTASVHSADSEPAWDQTAETGFRDWYGSRNDQQDRLDLAVTDKATGQFVGEVVFNEWSPENRSCNFRVMIGPRGRDRGLGTEAIRMFVGYGFEQLGLHRISLGVFAFNPRARRVYEKVGFVVEGVLRDEHRWEDQWIDSTVMSILEHEWRQHRGYP